MNGGRTGESSFSIKKLMSIVSQFIIGIFNIKRPVEKKQKRELKKEIKELEEERIK